MTIAPMPANQPLKNESMSGDNVEMSVEAVCDVIAAMELDDLEQVVNYIGKMMDDRKVGNAADLKRGADKARAFDSAHRRVEANSKGFASRWGTRITVDNMGVRK
jgi:hypothetical protein